jgi:uncharacterized damage-inducible protein DinB
MLEEMVRHTHWANGLLIAWLHGDVRERDYFVSKASHILRADKAWLDRAHGREWDRRIFDPLFPNALRNLNEECRDGWLALLRTGLADRTIGYHRLDGSAHRSSPREMIIHVFSHGFHHRGQMASRASALGYKLPDLSYIAFTRIG